MPKRRGGTLRGRFVCFSGAGRGGPEEDEELSGVGLEQVEAFVSRVAGDEVRG